MEFAGADGKGAEAVGESWLEAIGALEGVRSSEILLSFVDPNVKLFNREFIPDHRYGDLLARLLAERAAKDKALMTRPSFCTKVSERVYITAMDCES